VSVLFWSMAAVIAYAYVGYPLTVAVAARVLDRGVRKGAVYPRMSVIIAAYDEADSIGDKIRNVLASDYHADRLEVIVASDGSTDGTVRRASEVLSPRVRVLDLPRQGKAAALAAAVGHAAGDVLVFTDANTRFRRDSLGLLARSFNDPSVGGVAGRTTYVVGEGAEATGQGEDLYWEYDTWLKGLETWTGSVVSAHGGLYAVRRELFRPVEDPAVTDDFAISTAVVEQGRRLVFEPRAVAFERTMGRGPVEFRRRVRLMTRGIRGVLLRRRLLNPFRHGFYSVALASRKVVRRLVVLAFLPVLVASIALAPTSTFYAGAALGQVSLLWLAGLGWVLRSTPLGRWAVLYVPMFFCMANLAALVALWNVARGRRIERWTPHRHDSAADEGPAVAVPDRHVG
jgi:cellulose synthase/poly-beta-1,6-N-acetylglucosamine synthase-like glycosyltransferase